LLSIPDLAARPPFQACPRPAVKFVLTNANLECGAFGLTDRDHLPGVRPGQFAPAGKSAAFSDFREILAHIFFGFFHLGSKRQVERLPWNLIDSFNYVS
jgi:hypothetical protein